MSSCHFVTPAEREAFRAARREAVDDITALRRLRAAWQVSGVLVPQDLRDQPSLANVCRCLRVRLDALLAYDEDDDGTGVDGER